MENVTVEKGSITVNGTSLTVVNSSKGVFSVAIIPYTYENTVFNTLNKGDRVNLEFDVIGKYVARMMEAIKGEKYNQNRGLDDEQLLLRVWFLNWVSSLKMQRSVVLCMLNLLWNGVKRSLRP